MEQTHMSPPRLIDTARALVAGDKGLLAMDESNQVRLTDRQEDEVEAVNEVADATVRCLSRAVPAAVPGIAFLSGGQSAELASAHLNGMNVRFKSRLPWALAFSFARAIQQPALEIWKGDEAHVSAAQQALYHRARCNRAARRGEYTAAMERT
jgi:fructose-bisphosphate aldolase class 1